MRIALLGDTALFGINTVAAKQYKQRFAPIIELLRSCDYVIANLESPLTTETRVIGGKSAYLKGNPEEVEILNYLGITHVTLANNHMFDFKARGMEETISILEKQGIAWYGANGKIATIQDDNNKLVLMGYCCYSTNAKGLGESCPCVNIFNPQKIESYVDKYINDGFLPILSIHWGQEHVHYPNYDHVEVARKLCTDRKIVVHGHHPHVIQGIEEIGESIIAYSLGNFCFDDVFTNKSNEPLVKLSTDNKETFIIILTIEDNTITEYKLIPVSFESGIYQIDNSIMEKIRDWSEFLSTSRDSYIKKRASDLSSYINKRKELRNLNWYIKRMNFDSVSMILGARKNQKIYNHLIHTYIY